MAKTSIPLDIDALEQLIKDGARIVEMTRPVWKEIGKLAARVPPRRYLPIAAGVAAVGLLGVVAATTARRRKPGPAPEPHGEAPPEIEPEPIDVEALVE
jgi:hypothetical protein